MQMLDSNLTRQMKHRDRDMVPRTLVIAMFAMMFSALAIAGYARITDQPLAGVPTTKSVTKNVQITLQGTRTSGVAVLSSTGEQLAVSTNDKAGFIDVIWVAVTRARKVHGVEGNPPLDLVRRIDGRTAILDPATGWSIELIGYGADNVAAFARLLD